MRSRSPPRPTCPRPGSAGAGCCSAVRRSAAPPAQRLHRQRQRPDHLRSQTTSTALTLQSSLSDPKPKAALEAVMKDFTGPKTTLNTVAIEQFRAQLPTYLSSGNPPDVITWYAGSVARDYASKGLLLDVSDMWTGDGACAKFSPALKSLSSARRRQADLRPDQLLLVERLLPQVVVRGVGRHRARPPGTSSWRCTTRSRARASTRSPWGPGPRPGWPRAGSTTSTCGSTGRPTTASCWPGSHSFDSAEVRKVMDTYATLLPYFDPKGKSYCWQEAVTPMVQKKAGMYLIGAFITQSVPGDAQVDRSTSSRCRPSTRPSPVAEEAPTDGYFASAGHQERRPAPRNCCPTWPARRSSRSTSIGSGSSNLPTSPEVDTSKFSPLVQKGIKLLQETKDITQFFNRDSSDALQTTADAALNKFLDEPKNVGLDPQGLAGRRQQSLPVMTVVSPRVAGPEPRARRAAPGPASPDGEASPPGCRR